MNAKGGFPRVVAVTETHARTRAHLSPVYERPHYTLVPHYCMSFPGCSLSYDRNSAPGDNVLHARFFFFFFLVGLLLLVLTFRQRGREDATAACFVTAW